MIDADQRLVVDGSYRLQFEKSLLPDEDATQLLDDTRSRLFAAWLGRRSSRASFPNDFVACVARAIVWVWRKKRFATSPVSQHLYQWRVGIYGDDGGPCRFPDPLRRAGDRRSDRQRLRRRLP